MRMSTSPQSRRPASIPPIPRPTVGCPSICAGIRHVAITHAGFQNHGRAPAPQLPGQVRCAAGLAAAPFNSLPLVNCLPIPDQRHDRGTPCDSGAHAFGLTVRQRLCVVCRCQPAVPNDATIPLQNVTQAMLWQNQVGWGLRVHSVQALLSSLAKARRQALRCLHARTSIHPSLPDHSTLAPTHWAWRKRGGWPSPRVCGAPRPCCLLNFHGVSVLYSACFAHQHAHHTKLPCVLGRC